MYLGNNAAIRGCQEYFNRCAAAGSPIGATQTPTSYDNAASFNGTSQFLSVASNSSLNLSGTSFTICAWVNPIFDASGLKTIVAKSGSYALSVGEYNSVFFDFVDGSGQKRLQNLYGYGGATARRWNFLCVSVDSGVISFSVNGINIASNPQGGTVQGPTTFSGALVDTANSLTINGNSHVGTSYAGAIGPCAIWKRALTASEVTQLFNNGAGRTYASLDSGLRTNLISWWALNQTSVTADSHGTNTLTNTGSVTAPNIGPVVTALSDPRQLIVDFAQGIDQLGLWNQMVCWPLRRSQNASTTLTARSLGGLGTFDGTLFGLATSAWGANGLAISNPSLGSNAQRIDLASGIGTGGANIYSYGAGMITSSANFNRIIQIENATANTRNPFTSYGYLGGAQQFLQADLISGSNTQVSALQSNATIPLNTFGSMSAGVVGNTLTAYNNTTAGPTATSPGGWSAAPGESTRSLGVSYNGTLSMVVIGRFEASASLVTNLNNLYKQTLGLGLGLP